MAALARAAAAEGAGLVEVCGDLEAELATLSREDRHAFLDELGLPESGLRRMIHAAYDLLGLLTFFTTGPKEVRAWTIKRGLRAPQAAGKIHTDFEKGFIKAEVIWWEDRVGLGTEAAVRAAGKLGIEGKEYVVRDGDVMHFRFNN